MYLGCFSLSFAVYTAEFRRNMIFRAQHPSFGDFIIERAHARTQKQCYLLSFLARVDYKTLSSSDIIIHKE